MLPVPQTRPALVFKNMVFLDKMAFPDTRFWKPECSLSGAPDSACTGCQKHCVFGQDSAFSVINLRSTLSEPNWFDRVFWQ